jgi:hypothetical protein
LSRPSVVTAAESLPALIDSKFGQTEEAQESFLPRAKRLAHTRRGKGLAAQGARAPLSTPGNAVLHTISAMQNAPYDGLGRPLPRVDLDHVHVYSQTLQMSLGPSEEERQQQMAATRALGGESPVGSGSEGRSIDPPLSPGPPLRGYAARPIGRKSPEPGSPQAKEMQQQRDSEYQTMMQGILDRTRQHNQQQEQDEDRRVERLLKHIAHEQKFVDDLDETLELRRQTQFRRQQELYREWRDKVYNRIQKQIDAQLASLRTEDISTRRRQLMEDYIRISNQKKFGLYRDIIIESEYDPTIAHKALLKYEMSDQQDPLKSELLSQNLGNPKPKELGRTTLDARIWDRLHATPYGRFDRVIPSQPSADPSKCSRVPFEHYSFATGKAVLDRELPRGKRMDCSIRDMRQSRIFAPMDPVQPFAGFPPEYE